MTATTIPAPEATPVRHSPESRKRSLRYQLAVYVLVVGGLATLNLVRTPDHLWFLYVALGWGAGLLLQGLRLYFRD